MYKRLDDMSEALRALVSSEAMAVFEDSVFDKNILQKFIEGEIQNDEIASVLQSEFEAALESQIKAMNEINPDHFE